MNASIIINGKKYEGSGDTVREAIENIDAPSFTRVKSLLTIGERTIVLSPIQAVRLFSKNPMMREVALKQMSLRF